MKMIQLNFNYDAFNTSQQKLFLKPDKYDK